MEALLFYVFGAGALLAGANVVMRRQAVPAAVWLVVCFFFLAAEFLLLGSPFLAAVQILVYVGAIMVLFLFVIMLLDMRGNQALRGVTRQAAGLGMAAVIVGTAVAAVVGAQAARIEGVPPMDALVEALFTTYLLPFEVTSVLLVGAIVGALTLGRSESAGTRSKPGSDRRAIRLVADPSRKPPEPGPEAAEAGTE